MNLRSILQCPHCGFKVTERMSATRCVLRYVCPACQREVLPRSGDRCVFCSHGSVPCPAAQAGGTCCAHGEPITKA